MSEKFRITIIGSGPGGASAAARAAALGVSHVLLEAAPHVANTIYRFQKGKQVMDEPEQLPLRSNISFSAGHRENILATWEEELVKLGVNLRINSTVQAISGQSGNFKISLTSGEEIDSEFIVLAIGVQGNIRKLGVQGEDLPGVQYQLDDPDAYNNETIVVVGGGDAGVENALALAKQNRVILVNRQEEFSNCKKANFDLLMAEVTAGRIETRINSRCQRIDELTGGGFALDFIAQTPQGLEQINCHRVIARLGATPQRKLVESFGVYFPSADRTSIPQLTEQYESNVPGLYVIGSLAGYPLIKEAMNQGYEVVEYIQGNPVEPADENLLREKFASISDIHSASEGIELIRKKQLLFASLTTLQLREFILDSTVHTPQLGEVIFKRNDYSNTFYSILKGSVKIHIIGKDEKTSVINLGEGKFFGEMGLLSGRRRSATVIAGDDCVLVETPRRSMLKLLQLSPGVRRSLDEVSLKRIVRDLLGKALSESEIDHLVHEAKFKHFAVGEVLFTEGDKADGLYVVRRGSVTISRVMEGKEVVLAYVSAGNYVGEKALVSNSLRSATVKAASPTEVILLEAERVEAVMERNSSIRSHIDSRYLERVDLHDSLASGSSSGLIKFLMEQGVGEATDVLLIDYSLCVHCNNCETACANVHDGTSRLNREAGPTYEQIHVPASCRHCEHPHCMKECPPDAIHRSVNGEVFIDDSCIGCGNCQNNCPYDVIQMTVQKPYKPRNIWQILMGLGPSKCAPQEDEAPKKAVKCDMCKGLIGGPACERACPTGAAWRVNPEEFFDYVK